MTEKRIPGPSIQRVPEGDNRTRLVCPDCGYIEYANPKIVVGAVEVSPFDQGTNAVAKEAAKLTKEGKLMSVAGGGDTVAALAHAGVEDDFSYVSTAGGAFLEWLEGKTLPGVAVLRK